MAEIPNYNYEIAFPDFSPSESVRQDILKHLIKLEKYFDKIISCHVSVRALHHHSKKHFYHINIILKIPTDEIVINNDKEKDITHSDIYIAIKDSFKALERKIKKKVDKMREHLPNQSNYQPAIIKSFDPNQGYGFIEDALGHEIYFHQNALLNEAPSKLTSGAKVEFLMENGVEGLQVTSLTLV